MTNNSESAGDFKQILEVAAIEAEMAADTNVAISFLVGYVPRPWRLAAIDPEGKDNLVGVCTTKEREASAFIDKWKGKRNLYYHPNAATRECNKAKLSKADIPEATVQHVDIDFKDFGVDPRDREAVSAWKAENINRLELDTWPPHAIIDTGGGIQALWELKQPYASEKVEQNNRALVQRFKGDRNCTDVSHLMRLPGTVNIPNAKKALTGRVPVVTELVYSARADDNRRPGRYGIEYEEPAKVAPPTLPQPTGPARSVEELMPTLPVWLKEKIGVVDTDNESKYDEDRSDYVYGVTCALFEAGASADEAYAVLEGQPCAERYGRDYKKLRADVDRTYEKWTSSGGQVKNGPAAQAPSAVKPKPLSSISARLLAGVQLPPVKYLVEGLIAEGTCILAGAPKKGKSWMALDLAIAVATGGHFLDRKCVQGDVLYLALEDNKRRLQDRLKKLSGGDEPQNLEMASLEDKTPGVSDGLIDRLRERRAGNPQLRLVIVDTLQKVRAPATGKSVYQEDYKAVGAFQELTAECPGLAVLIIHHTRKGAADDPYETVSGSYGLTGASDANMILAHDSKRGCTVLHGTGRDIEGFELAVEFDKTTWRWHCVGDGNPDTVNRSETRKKIMDTLADGPLTRSELASATGLNRDKVNGQIRRLVRSGDVQASGDKVALADAMLAGKQFPAPDVNATMNHLQGSNAFGFH